MSGPKHNIVVFADGWSENDNFTPSRDLTSETTEGQAQVIVAIILRYFHL